MTRLKSYRALLTRRFAFLWALSLLIIGMVLHVAVRSILLKQVDTSLSLIASLQASAIAESPPDSMRLREWELDRVEEAQLKDILWYMQVWNQNDQIVLRSDNLHFDLPAPKDALTTARNSEVRFRSTRTATRRFREILYPLGRIDPRHRGHVVQAAVSLRPLDRTLRHIDEVLGGMGLVGLTLVTLLGWSVASRSLQPISRIVRQVSSISSASEKNQITAYAETTEFADLVRVINDMLRRLQRSYELQERFTADASHELRSPLTAMRGELEVALRRPRDISSYQATLTSVLEEVTRMQDLVADLLMLARHDAEALRPRLENVSPAELVGAVQQLLQSTAAAKRANFLTDVPPNLRLWADRGMVRRVLINLMDNAIRHTAAGSTVKIVVCQMASAIVLSVEDEGPGVAMENRERIFERFFRLENARTAGEGVGLGLALTRAMVEAHGGTIQVEAGTAGGARFVVRLPGMGGQPGA